ncbi:phosphoribosylformylglycinamidine synthase [Citroniella saccharovorans]|uniref:Phosphoribosylformylglycinamidine synthase n=1 Tax=Citroniella saccharovorans TaxID=2053367 RepID=A0AAW9MSA9_9FIRM|nr:phosphoribosylformylglycinamidine synthase [Citroniella saccharovorans]MEB3428763.1 phosphoribosylformylglycinamidine synthase [Citroniella saccharovorans]
MKKRFFVRKKEIFRTEEELLLKDLNEKLDIKSLSALKIYNIYDCFDVEGDDLTYLKEEVLTEKFTDEIFDKIDLENKTFISYEFIPGAFDQRADSARQCLMLKSGSSDAEITSGKLIVFEDEISEKDYEIIKKYLINPVESRIKDLDKLELESYKKADAVKRIEGFISLSDTEMENFLNGRKMAMSLEDLLLIRDYFKNEEKRDPSETELKVLDTYWSDHCRHTTFETSLKDIKVMDDNLKGEIEKAFERYLKLRKSLNREDSKMSLMDMAQIVGRYFKKEGLLKDQEETSEINACSIEIEVDEDGEKVPYLLMFKNETHNHPTEIEPFGGASTCLGGAIRDPLSGRSFVYGALRVTGAGNILEDIKDTIPNKLPQALISKEAANGYSSYGNQIGLASTFVREFYHEGFKAKRMELGAVIAAAPKENVVRLEPKEGDVVILLGGKTGRDGIGGATGSSISHDKNSLESSGAEVQKGNAPIERKIQRLFRNSELTKLIKKSNDFGAGGVSVAIGELSDSIDIDLDKVPLKYKGLSGTEIAISESQERMAIVIDSKDYEKVSKLAKLENLDATLVARVTSNGRLRMKYEGEYIVDLSRDFLNTNGASRENKVEIKGVLLEDNPYKVSKEVNKENIDKTLLDLNVNIQKGMVEKFDASVGRSTVLWPYGGKYQLTESDISIQKIPTFKKTNTVSLMSMGYNPFIASYSPYLGAYSSVVEALAKIVAAGGNYKGSRLTNQEYFEKLGEDPKKWGKVTGAMLGLIDAELDFDVVSIGGKDSMSGTFEDLNVAPSLVTFAVNTSQVDKIISPEFKKEDSYIYLAKSHLDENFKNDSERTKKVFEKVMENIEKKNIISAMPIKLGGVLEAAFKMGLGNRVGFEIEAKDIFSPMPGSILIEAREEISEEDFILLGKTNLNSFKINGIDYSFDEAQDLLTKTLKKIYPIYIEEDKKALDIKTKSPKNNFKYKENVDKPKVLIPVFPGTNSEYDTKKAFEREGFEVEVFVLNNLSKENLLESVDKLSKKIEACHILTLVGGFSMGDEPDGSAKFIANVLSNEKNQRKH